MAGAKRGTQWFDTNVQLQVVNGSGSSLVALLPADVLARDVPGLTIVRTLVGLSIHPAVPISVFGSQQVRMGCGIITVDAFLAGAVPDVGSPSEEPVRGWIFKNERYPWQSEDNTFFDRLDLDIHAQMKLDLDTEVFFYATNTGMTGTSFTIEVTGLIRMLVKLP